MFGFFKKGLYRRMWGYCAGLQVATCMKLTGELSPTHGRENAIKIAAAITNRVFAQAPSPVHADLDQTMVQRLSEDFISHEQDAELFRGIVLALRTMMTIRTDEQDADATSRIADTIQWIKGLRPLPNDAPNPADMEALSTALRERYPAR
jgi:hypothetical protein